MSKLTIKNIQHHTQNAAAEQEHPALLPTAAHLHFWQISPNGNSNSLHVTSVFNAMNAYQCAWRDTGNRSGLAGPFGMDGVWPWARSVPEQYSGLPAVQMRVK